MLSLGNCLLYIYRVFSKGRNVVGPFKSLIFWTFSDVLDFFWPFNMGDFSFWYIWVIWLKKKVEKSHSPIRLNFRVGSNWLNFGWLNFGGCQLWVQLSQAILSPCCKFPEIFETPLTFSICMVLKIVMDKNLKK